MRSEVCGVTSMVRVARRVEWRPSRSAKSWERGWIDYKLTLPRRAGFAKVKPRVGRVTKLFHGKALAVAMWAERTMPAQGPVSPKSPKNLSSTKLARCGNPVTDTVAETIG